MKTQLSESILRHMLEWFMCSDPWPVDNAISHEEIAVFLTEECKRHGFDTLTDAYHYLVGGQAV